MEMLKLETYSLKRGNSSITYCEDIDWMRMDNPTFNEIWELHPKNFDVVRMCGKMVKTPRWSQSFGRDYRYSGVNHKKGKTTHPFLTHLKECVEEMEGVEYQQMLINWYEDGNHHIGPHSDDERDLVPNSSIYSFSFGATRTFRIRNKQSKKIVLDLELPNNSLVVMEGEMQKYYTHEVPKRLKVKERRINITFRRFNN